MVRFERVHERLAFSSPVQVLAAPDRDDVVYVVEQRGRVRRVALARDAEEKEVVLDIKDRVQLRHSEEGLLSIAFAPDFAESGHLYAYYVAAKPRRTVLSRFDRDGDAFDPASEEVLLEVAQPWGNHNGGTVVFGPDGYLYLGYGDGGAANDPKGAGQDRSTLLATIDEDRPYAVPLDNPFVGEEGVRDEIWAWGLRNPWRMSFDRQTGELWTGDVGQNAWEEIDIIVRGGNYGWKLREGEHPFKGDAEGVSVIEPIHEYGRASGGSITGGHVYRGTSIPGLSGAYLFNDYMSRRTWAIARGKDGWQAQQIVAGAPIAISSFGELQSGEILACGFEEAYDRIGRLYRLAP
jgi:glucose/arabinose dehydrogenase